MVYHGIPDFNQIGPSRKKNQVITVGELNKDNYLRKGLDLFIKVAKKLPDVAFIHIGKWSDNNGRPCSKMIDYVKTISPSNIQYLGFIEREALEKYYQGSKVYLQLSRHEAFGVSVVEAIMGGCVPIVSNCYALPEIIGDSGYIVEDYVDETVEIIKKILQSDYASYTPNVRLNFSVEKRRKKIMKIFK